MTGTGGERRPALILLAIFGALYLAANVARGNGPGLGTPSAHVAEWAARHAGALRWYGWLLALALITFSFAAAFLRRQLGRIAGDVFLFGAVAFVVETAVQSWAWLAVAAVGASDPSADRALLDLSLFWGPVLTSATVVMLAPLALPAHKGHVGQVARAFAVVAIAEQLVETVTIFGRSGFVGPGQGMNSDLGAGLVAVALITTAAANSCRRSPAG